MAASPARRARMVSVAAATAISIACGTNYAYSAWGPEYAERLQLSATESNIIGAAGNIGMYAMGIPAGLIIDNRGPRLAVLMGAISLGWGYLLIYRGYISGPGTLSVALLAAFSFMTGAGSCSAFSAAVKTCAFNWPENRGTATAFPLSGFGLSAFFFTTISNMAFPDNTEDYLLMLTIGTFTLCILSIAFIRLIPITTQLELEPSRGRRSPTQYDRNRRSESGNTDRSVPLLAPVVHVTEHEPHAIHRHNLTHGRSRSHSQPIDHSELEPKSLASVVQRELTGLPILYEPEFYQLFAMLGLLAGVGLMTINNIGNDAKALWSHWDGEASHDFIQTREQMHVSLLSLFSFLGRFLSGAGSDVLVKRLHMSRFWCLVVSASVFAVAQICALGVDNPNWLFLVSCLTGVGYGALFGVFPALTADAFGVQGLSLNWGFMIFAPVLTGNVFNLLYGRVYDDHSSLLPGGQEHCGMGLDCYRNAYWITLASSMAGILVALYCIRYEHIKKRRILRESVAEGLRDA